MVENAERPMDMVGKIAANHIHQVRIRKLYIKIDQFRSYKYLTFVSGKIPATIGPTVTSG